MSGSIKTKNKGLVGEMKKHALLIDYKYCTGCHSCEVACRQEKNFESQDEWGIKVTEFGPEKFDGRWYWDYVPVPSSLCDICEDRIAQGMKPACVHHCLALVMEAVSIDDVPKRLAELGESVAVFTV
jgi:Fe-S-cluster-containing dehydrogenase component